MSTTWHSRAMSPLPGMNGYRCTVCNRRYNFYDPRCPNCWTEGSLAAFFPRVERGPTDTVATVARRRVERVSTGLPNLDLVFGGNADTGFGMARPSCFLLSGTQGGGKSTLCLQIAQGVGGHRVVYLAAEEVPAQIADRVERLGLLDDLAKMRLVEVHDMAEVEAALAGCERTLVIVDSLNEVTDARRDGGDENANTLRRVQWFYDHANAANQIVLMVAQLNKDDDIAGHRKIQYKPDAAVKIEAVNGSKTKRKVSCPTKNRFGQAGLEAHFLMTPRGLVPTAAPEEPDEDEDTGRPAARDDEPLLPPRKRRR